MNTSNQPRSSHKAKEPDDFESVAKRLGADEDKDRFESVLGKIARAKPIKKAKKPATK
jgi:hypothetical protein